MIIERLVSHNVEEVKFALLVALTVINTNPMVRGARKVNGVKIKCVFFKMVFNNNVRNGIRERVQIVMWILQYFVIPALDVAEIMNAPTISSAGLRGTTQE